MAKEFNGTKGHVCPGRLRIEAGVGMSHKKKGTPRTIREVSTGRKREKKANRSKNEGKGYFEGQRDKLHPVTWVGGGR